MCLAEFFLHPLGPPSSFLLVAGRTGVEKEGDAGVEVDEHGDGGQRGSDASSYELEGSKTLAPLRGILQGLWCSWLETHLS